MSGRDRSVSKTYSVLRTCATRESERATHVALDGGMWCVNDWNSFWNAASHDILEGKLFPICEMRSEEFPMFVDFDVKVSTSISKPDDFILTIVRTINKQIPKFFQNGCDPSILETYILKCERSIDGENKNKYGYHIHWPNLIVNQYNAFLIRMSAISGCRTLVKPGNFYSHIDMEEAFDITPFKNSKGSLRIMGAPKPKLCPECNNTSKLKKNCNMCIRSGYITPDPFVYKLDSVLFDQDVNMEKFSEMKNTSRLLRTICINTPGKTLTQGFEKYMECPEPDIFIHNPKKEPTLLNVAKVEEKLLPKGAKYETVTDTTKLNMLLSLVSKFGTNMINNPYENTTIRRVVYGPIGSKEPRDKGKMQYIVNLQDEGSNFCPFKKCNHRGNHIFMKVLEGYSGHGFAQLKCYDEKCSGLTFGKKHLSEHEMEVLFKLSSKNDKKMIMKLNNPQDAITDADNMFLMMLNTNKKQKN